VTDRVYRGSPYKNRPRRATRNATDSIFVNGGRKSVLSLHGDGGRGYVGSITMGVSRS
jgi:hypothetical protein